MSNAPDASTLERELPQRGQSASELSFYGAYPWCLNVCPTIHEVVENLRRELCRLDEVAEEWQRAEVMTNVFLLSCAITDSVDDYLLGERYDFAQIATVLPWTEPVVRTMEKLLNASRRVRERRLSRVRDWRERWGAGVVPFLRVLAAGETPSRDALADARAGLSGLLSAAIPAGLLSRRPRMLAAFRTQDLTHFDILTLGRTFVSAFSDRQRPVVVV